MKKEIEIKLEDGTFIRVKRLQLFDLAVALKKIQKIPAAFSGLGGASNEQVMAFLPQMIGENLEEFADVLSVATNKSKEDIMGLGISDTMQVIEAILEVNRFEDIKRFLSMIRSRGQGMKLPGSKSKKKA